MQRTKGQRGDEQFKQAEAKTKSLRGKGNMLQQKCQIKHVKPILVDTENRNMNLKMSFFPLTVEVLTILCSPAVYF